MKLKLLVAFGLLWTVARPSASSSSDPLPKHPKEDPLPIAEPLPIESPLQIESPQSDKELSQVLVTPESGDPYISCPGVMTTIDYECPAAADQGEDSNNLVFKADVGAFQINVAKKTEPNRPTAALSVYPMSDPKALEKARKSLVSQWSFDNEKILKVLNFDGGKDFLTTLAPIGETLELFFQIRKDAGQLPDEDRASIFSAGREAWKLVKYLHENSLVAVDFHFSLTPHLQLRHLLCLTQIGEPVGPCWARKEVVDPRLTGDWQVPADPAMDYFVLGYYLWENFVAKDVDNKLQAFEAVKTSKSVEIPEGTMVPVALLLCVLLHEDTALRTNEVLLETILGRLAEKAPVGKLPKSVTFNFGDSPLKVAEFQEEIASLGINPDNLGQSFWSTTWGKWTLVGAACLLFVGGVLLVFFLIKGRSDSKEDATQARKELDETEAREAHLAAN